jgi:dTDP-4-amino-4,6-dideoxygalactose transaminase
VHAGYDIAFGEVDPAIYCLRQITEGSLPTNLYGNRAKEGARIYDSAHRIEKDDVKGSDALWCYSLYSTKNISVVSGGVIATNDADVYAWLRKARDHGLSADTKERYSGTYKQYDVEFVGWRMKADDVRAAIGLEQLKKLPAITERRNEIVALYNKGFDRDWKGNHVYGIFVENQEAFINHMYSKGIQTTVHFRPLHTMTAYRPYYHGEPLPVTEFVGTHEVSLPLFPQLTDDQVAYIVTTARESGMLTT